MEAHFDIWADRMLARIPEADLIALLEALEQIRLVLLADCDYMRRKDA
jgi:hypothetical protein